MIKFRNKGIIFLLLVFFLATVVLISLLSFKKYKQDLKYQFFCVDIHTGMQKDDVKSVLAEYGNYSWQDDYALTEWAYVYFDKFWIRTALGNPIVLRFDIANKLMAISSREKVGDEIQIDCVK
jgi:hypothetical protein